MFQQCTRAIAEKPPFSWFQGSQNYQFLMLGLEGAGKTTFLYKLKVNGYKKADIIKDMAFLKQAGRDPGYHFEELQSSITGPYAIWEVPGNDMMRRLWPMFYRYVRIRCVLFVVDAFTPDACSLSKENIQRLAKARDSLHFLLNEDELRTSAFYLVLNVDDTADDADEEEHKEQQNNALFEMLGVPEIEQRFPDRFRTVTLNCASVTRKDPKWEGVLREVHKIQLRINSS
eukprot:gb/GFBE01063623.1/.p1 GENE.gb/GFBE01063623.1/~~gb/GFBE01063623.1/.p1  ORF type:complete len:230 (+),score=53.24 gb/GFBE01063623.1/:1-690(+)